MGQGLLERVFPLIKRERYLRRNSLPSIDFCFLPSKDIALGAAAVILQPGEKGQDSIELLLGAAQDQDSGPQLSSASASFVCFLFLFFFLIFIYLFLDELGLSCSTRALRYGAQASL